MSSTYVKTDPIGFTDGTFTRVYPHEQLSLQVCYCIMRGQQLLPTGADYYASVMIHFFFLTRPKIYYLTRVFILLQII